MSRTIQQMANLQSTNEQPDQESRPLNGFVDCCSEISVIGDQMTTIAKKANNGWASIYGSKIIKLDQNEIIKYRIKINKLSNPSQGLMFIGICSNNLHSNGRYSFYNDNKNYSYRSDGVIYHNSKYFRTIKNEGGYKTNDIITLTINPISKKISFHKNNVMMESQKYSNASSLSYRLAISLFNKHDSISIINQDDDENRDIHPHSGSKGKTQSTAEDIISQLVSKNDSLNTEIKLLRQQLACMKLVNRELQFENRSLKKQNRSISMTVIETDNYRNWTVSQVLNWMMDIDNGRYLKYFEMLNIRLNDAQLTGKKLTELDYVDIKQLGIIDTDDRKYLYRQIQLLVAKNKQYMMEGNVDYKPIRSCSCGAL